MKTNKVKVILAGLVIHGLFFSGITRHDVDENEYLSLAKQPHFDCVGQIYIDTSSVASAVVIESRYVLTAAHSLIVSDYQNDTLMIDGQMIITYTPTNNRVVEPEKLFVSIDGKMIRAKRVVLHPYYTDSLTAGACDIALIELTESFKGLKPAALNFEYDELNDEVVGVGFGASGMANQPEKVGLFDKKIAGQNVVDSIGGYIYSGMPSLLFCDFDHPTDNNCNKMGSSTPQRLEYLCAGGDSGGGLFRRSNSSWELVGVCSGSHTDIQQLISTGYYGQTMAWTRVSLFEKWLKENMY